MMSQLKSNGVVLVVDDSADSLELLNEALINEGYTIFIAMDGLQAVTIAERMEPDVIIMDAIMPNMDGFEACRQIKKNRELKDVPVIFMTGLSDSEDVVRGLKAGGVDYINKPVNIDELIARVHVHLENSRITRSARRALDEIGQYAFACDLKGQFLWCTASARTFISNSGLDTETLETLLPEQIRPWLLRSPEKNSCLSVKGLNTPLKIKFIGMPSANEFLLRFLQEGEEEIRTVLRENYQLTDREIEVLYWIAQGKANRDIAQILNMSPRTVNKHLEQIYKKLDVDNRTSAATIYLQQLTHV